VASKLQETSSVVIVCRDRADIGLFQQALQEQNCDAIEIDKRTPGFAEMKKVHLTTYHTVKGLEFD